MSVFLYCVYEFTCVYYICMHLSYICICVALCAINYVCAYLYACKVMGWVYVWERVWQRQRPKELETSKERNRDRKERDHLSQYSLGSAYSSEPCYCSSARAQSLPPAGDISWCHLALQSSCTYEKTQEGGFFWKRTKVKEKQKAEEAKRRSCRLLKNRQRQRMHVGDAVGKPRKAWVGWLTLGQSKAFISLQ